MRRQLVAMWCAMFLVIPASLALAVQGGGGGAPEAPARETAAPAPAPAPSQAAGPAAVVAPVLDLENPGPWARQAIDLALERGWFMGFEDNFRWKTPATREQLAVVLVRLVDWLNLDQLNAEELAVLTNAVAELRAGLAAQAAAQAALADRLTQLDARLTQLKLPPDSSQDVQTLFEAVADLQTQMVALQELVGPALDLGTLTTAVSQLRDNLAQVAARPVYDPQAVAQLADQVAVVQEQLAQVFAHLDEMHQMHSEERAALEASQAELAAELANHDAALRSLADELATVAVSADTARAQADILTDELATLMQLMRDLAARVDAAQEQAEAHQQATRQLGDKVESVSIATDTATALAESLAEDLASALAQVRALSEWAQVLEGDGTLTRTAVEANTDAIAALNDIAALLNSDILSLQDRTTLLEKLLAGIDLNQLQDRLAALEGGMDGLVTADQLLELSTRLEALSAAVDTAMALQDDLAQRLGQTVVLLARLSQQQADLAETVANLQAVQQAQAESLGALAELSITLNQDVLNLQDRVGRLEQAVAQLPELSQQVAQLEEGQTQDAQRMDALAELSIALNQDVLNLQDRLAQLEKGLSEAATRADLTALAQRLAAIVLDVQSLDIRVAVLEELPAELAAVGDVANLATESAAQANQGVQAANAAIAALEARVKALETALAALAQRVTAAEKKNSDQDATLARVLERVSALESSNVQLKTDLSASQKNLTELNASNRELREFVLPQRGALYLGVAGYLGDTTGEIFARFTIGHDALLGNLGLRASYELPFGSTAQSLSGDLTYRISQGAIDGFFGAGYGAYLNTAQTQFGQIHVGIGYRLLYNLGVFFEGTQRYLFNGTAAQRSNVMLGLQLRY